MKIYKIIFFIAICAFCQNSINADDIIKTNITEFLESEKDNILVYDMSKESIRIFLENPNRDVLLNNYKYISSYTKNEFDNTIRKKEFNGVNTVISNEDMFINDIKSLYKIDGEFIKLLSNKQGIENLLAENKIYEDIINIALLDVLDYPATIWIETNMNNYFITINAGDNDIYKLTFYNLENYKNIVKEKQGKLIVNDMVIAKPNSAVFDYSSEWISLKNVFEALGTNVTWNNPTKCMLFCIDNCTYKIDLKNNCFVQLSGKNGICKYQWFGIKHKQITDDVFIEAYELNKILKEFNMETAVNRDEFTVDIKFENCVK